MRRKLVFGILLTVSTVLVAGSASAQSEGTARAAMMDAKNSRVGEAVLTQMKQGVLIRLELTGLSPGWHGLHIHETGTCEPPFASAGGHFNPDRKQHGLANEEGHAGDLPNIYVGPNGEGRAEMVTGRIALSDPQDGQGFLGRATGAAGRAAGEAPKNILGGPAVALVVHAGPDDYRSDPAGNSGSRIACGVIQRP